MHPLDAFLAMLKAHSIDMIWDVRSSPYSQRNPQYNRESLDKSLQDRGLSYQYAGDVLGGRSRVAADIDRGKVSYRRIAQRADFQDAIGRLGQEASRHRIALMCAEKDPAGCHRAILICRNLRGSSLQIQHILEDGTLESQGELERRLLQIHHLPERDMFTSSEEYIERAYDLQARGIAFSPKGAQAGSQKDRTEETSR